MIAIVARDGQSGAVEKISEYLNRFPTWIALVAGGLSALGFEPWSFWPLTLTCFAVLIQLIAQAPTGRKAFSIGYLFGIGHFTIGNQWIAVAFTFQAAMPVWLGYFAVVALSLYIAVYPALAAFGAWRLGQWTKDETGKSLVLAFAAFWIITEWLRSWVFTGFVWNPLGVSFITIPWLPEAARTVGTYGLSGLVVALSGTISLLVRPWFKSIRDNWSDGSWLTYMLGGFLIFVLGVIWAFSVFTPRTDRWSNRFADEDILVTIVQPNIPQSEKYDPNLDAINFTKLARFSHRLPGQEPRLLLWPEAAIPDYLEDDYPFRFYQFQPGESAEGARARLMTLLTPGDAIITGANRLVIRDGQLVAARNSAIAMNADGGLLGYYDKAHLVPYGEYLPLPWLLRTLGLARLVPGDIDFWPGPGPQTINVKVGGKDVRVGMQICYEMIFSGQVVDRKHRPDFIFNPSNDAWFGTVGPPQHLAQARLRAIEEGLPVVRATPTGISAVIDTDGQIVESIAHGKAGRIDLALPQARQATLFARYGNILPLAFAALLIGFAFYPLARRRASR